MSWTQFTEPKRRRGAVAVTVCICLVMFVGFGALVVDSGHMYNVRAELQDAADAAARAAASQLPNKNAARWVALTVAWKNYSSHGSVLSFNDVVFGNWNPGTASFAAGGAPTNAVRVVTQRGQSNGNSVDFFFASIFGMYKTDLAAGATAFSVGTAPAFGTRFLIDDEMFDTDVPTIQAYADDIGWTTDELLEDNDGDDFIDFPPTVIELPTGQVGDEALFDVGPAFPFTSVSSPSLEDFLLLEEGGDQHGILASQLDPLLGVDPVSDPNRYPEFVSPAVLVSPVYKSDVGDTNPGVNALGERRGLVAFKIIGIGTDPDGPGSILPNLIVEIVDPSTLNALDSAVLIKRGTCWWIGSARSIVRRVVLAR